MVKTNESAALENLVMMTLAGIEKVSPETFIRIAQRVVLISGKLHTLTAMAFMTGQPGLELTDPTALTMPEQIPTEEREKIKAVLPQAAEMLQQIRQDMETALHRFTIEADAVCLPETENSPIAKQFQQALLDEALYLIKAGSVSELTANLGLVMKGVGIILEDHHDEPDAVNIPFGLINRLPDRRDEILAGLKPFCTASQWERLIKAYSGK